MTVVLLHLSDIHIKAEKDPILKRATDIAACVYSMLPAAAQVFIVVSGDIAFAGRSEEYVLAAKFLKSIRDAIQVESSCLVTFIVAPGNHDCDFEANTNARKMLVKSLDEGADPVVDDSIVQACTSVQQAFFDFRRDLEENPAATDDLLWRSSYFTIEGKTLAFEALNISWVSKQKEDPGRLYFPVHRYDRLSTPAADVRLVVLHHPLNWFNQSMYRKFRMFVRNRANIVISGHEHQGNVGVINEAESDRSAFIEGCVLQGEKDLSDSSFNVATLDLGQSQFASTRYKWGGTLYLATEQGSWLDYHDLPAKRTNPFALSSTFQGVLDDPGAFFRHPGGQNITLSDVYIFPDLHRVGEDPERRRVLTSSSRLLAAEVTASGILIEGEEKAGATSLLYQLFRQYHERGFVPLYLKGKDLRKISDTEIDTLLRHTVELQYGKAQSAPFEQLPSSKKLLLLDDFDDGPMKDASARASLLCALRKRFGHIVVTVSEMFEMREMLEVDGSRSLLSLEHYQLQPFGYALRARLIERWFQLGSDGTLDEGAFSARCDQAERLMNAVLKKTVIPSMPLYLLTLLQSMESGRTGDFKESALGYYYQYLLTEAFQSVGVKPDKLTEVFQYAAHLAWEYHVQQKRELSEGDLRDFNTRFTKEWHTVDFLPRLESLLAARVLRKVGEDYAFRYPYIYYYLKGQYLSENLNDLDIRAYIGHCCQHLYVRDHANTVLFLAHHTNDDYVLNCISGALHTLFKTRVPMTFDGDTRQINTLIQDAPKLRYSAVSPTEHRKRNNALRDEMEERGDGLVEAEETSAELSLIAQMTMLFKTTEILGQVLKNQYSKIQRVKKGALLEELFNGPLRALHDFYAYFEDNPDALVAEIEAAIERKGKVKKEEERKEIARKVVAGFIQLLTFAFVLRAAQSANADSLAEDVRDVVAKRGTPAFRLIELGILLDSPKKIPREKLKSLHKLLKDDVVAVRLIQMMVLNRLYMFKTAEKDMQWLQEEVSLDLGIQHAIAYQEKKKRLLK